MIFTRNARKNAKVVTKNVPTTPVAPARKEPTLVEYSTFWLDTYKAGLRTNTRHNYVNIISKFNKSNCSISRLSKRDYIKILDGETDYMKTRIALTLKQVVKCAINDNLMDPLASNYIFANVSLPKPQTAQKRALTQDETEAVYNVQLKNDMDLAYLWIIFGCGLRREEALALRVEDITPRGLSINKTWIVGDKGTGTIENAVKSVNSRRIVPIPSFLSEYIEYYISTDDYVRETGYLFTMHQGKYEGDVMTLGAFQAMWKRINKQLDDYVGYKTGLTSHSFRHNYCSNLCYQVPTISIRTVAALMGDTVDVVMNTYNHVVSEREDRLGAIEAALKI